MKTSRLGVAALVALGLATGLTVAPWPPATAQESTYQPWGGSTQAQGQTADQKLQKLVTDLNALIKKAESANAADPQFPRRPEEAGGAIPGRTRRARRARRRLPL